MQSTAKIVAADRKVWGGVCVGRVGGGGGEGWGWR